MVAFSKQVSGALAQAARDNDVSLPLLRAICFIESSGNPRTVTGQYKGLFQINATQFRQFGGRGSILDPVQNAQAGARLLKQRRLDIERRLGRQVTDAELYLAHQQGVSGAIAHLHDRERPAWKSMHSTNEGKRRGQAWSRRAIWGNLPTQAKTKFGSVDNVSSGDFVDWWVARFDRALEQTREA